MAESCIVLFANGPFIVTFPSVGSSTWKSVDFEGTSSTVIDLPPCNDPSSLLCSSVSVTLPSVDSSSVIAGCSSVSVTLPSVSVTVRKPLFQ